MATLMLWVWLLALYSINAAPIQVAHGNFRHAVHLNLSSSVETKATRISSSRTSHADNRSHDDNTECGVASPVSADSDMYRKCPARCPLYVEDKRSGLTCAFACVPNTIESCTNMNPMTPVPDLERGECRRCEVHGCDLCLEDGTDRCATCLWGYEVDSNGKCGFSGAWRVGSVLVYSVLIIIALGFGLFVWWIVDLAWRDEVNKENLEHALMQRSRAKIHQPKPPGEIRSLWPLSTNLCKEDVAGPAVKNLFNFQMAIIVWATVLALVWWCLTFVDSRLQILGTREAETARQDCINVKWGYHTMHGLMWAKIGFLEFAYLFSFFGAIIFGIAQRRSHDHHGIQVSTHQDFALVLRGVPEIPGTEKVEANLQAAVRMATEECPIGVSVGWQMNYKAKEVLQAAIELRIQEQQTPRYSSRVANETVVATNTSCWGWLKVRLRICFIWVEKIFVHPTTQRILARGRRKAGMRQSKGTFFQDKGKFQNTPREAQIIYEEQEAKEVKGTIDGLKSSSSAFVVFETLQARDNAANILKKVPMEFAGKTLQAEVPTFEPSAVLWHNLGPERTMKQQCWRVLGISVFVSMMIGLLFLFEYMYYHIQLNSVFATGEETISLSFLVTTMMVVLVMAVLCTLSAEVADLCAFERVGSREACYVVLYTFSVILQVMLDLWIAYMIGKQLLDVNEIHTYDGKKIADLDHTKINDFVEIFEAYAMQKQLGVTVLSFGVPLAFLVPFILEPIISIYMPYKISSFIVRSHSEVKRQSAEEHLEAVPMDLGRYGDIIINVIVASLILWFPGGFTLQIFMFLAFSHLYIYWYDHYRVLRTVQNIYISSYNAEWVAQLLFSIPCAIIAAALVFKSNCDTQSPIAPYAFVTTQLYRLGIWGSPCDDGYGLVFKVLLTFFGHLAFHFVVLVYLVPWCSRAWTPEIPKEILQKPYSEMAKEIPCSWFNANLVHCLRSELVYHHNPPFDYCVIGKEHLLRANEDIGAFFTDNKAEMEDYDSPSRHLSRLRSYFTPKHSADDLSSDDA